MSLTPAVWRPMQLDDVDAVVSMEQTACMHPLHAWSADNYRSSLRSGYWLRVCVDAQGALQGVCVVMLGVEEAHLLNIAVAQGAQGQGLAQWMLAKVDEMCQSQVLRVVWLEVRPSNAAGLKLYRAQDYALVGTRKAYYPAVDGREDAWVMKRKVPHASVE
jgi:[ribosomal protein S18]-alanine N-acetyltransferase